MIRVMGFWLGVLAGMSSLAYAAYIPAKAWLAQQLLVRAWQLSVEQGRPIRPWPWADTVPVARLRQRRLGIDQVVLDGASGRVLAFGPGHVSGTVRPGIPGNSVLSGHRDTHFSWLRELREGDRLTLETASGPRRYGMASHAIVHESETALLGPEAGDRLQLLTCYPFDGLSAGTPYRYVVTFYPVPNSAA